MLDDLASLWAKLQLERETITALVQPLGDAALDRPGPDGCWSVRQTLAHIAASEHALLSLAQRIAAGDKPQVPAGYNLHEANAAAVGRRQGRSVAVLLTEWEQRRAEWASFLETVTPGQLQLTGGHPAFDLQVTLLQLVIVMLKHERNHKAEIISLLARP